MRKKGLFRLVALLALAALTLGFATCSYAMDISGAPRGNDFIWDLRANSGIEFVRGSFFGKDSGPDWTCDQGMENIRPAAADKASTTGTLSQTLDLLTVRVSGAYPGYYNSVSFQVYNGGAAPVVMPRPVLHWMGQDIAVTDGMVITLAGQAGNPVVECSWLNNTGRTLYPGKRFEEVFDFHFLSVPEPPEIPELNGLTPGYWKNWRNHYTPAQFSALLKGTIAGDTATADSIFKKYSAAPGKELTILQAHLLAAQLTLNLTKMADLPNPDGACLVAGGKVKWNGATATVGEAVAGALDILAGPGAFSRQQILDVKDLLDRINNL